MEELADYLAGQAEQDLPRAAHAAIASRSDEYGELIAETLATIVDRDQYFHRSAANRDQIAISMISPNQLQVPHDPAAGVGASAVEGIEAQAPPSTPSLLLRGSLDRVPSSSSTGSNSLCS